MKFTLPSILRGLLALLFRQSKVGDVLEREGNNFDLLRALAASMVILGHAFALAPDASLQDPLLSWVYFEYSGGLAVCVFFFLSGMLVCDSYNRSNHLPVFLLARLARVLPALLCSLLLCIYIVGPLFTTLSLAEYFKSREVYSYFTRNALLTDLQWRLPGVFDASKFGLNGAMWSLPLEVRLYIVVGFVGLMGLLKGPLRATMALVALFILLYYKAEWVPYFLGNQDFIKPSLSFIFGVWLAANKHWVRVNLFGVLVLVSGCFVFWDTAYKQLWFYPAVYWFCLWCFSTEFSRRIRLPGDYSYGIYIYGFVVQQCVAALVFPHTPYANFLISLLITLILAAASWHYVELPVLAAWRSLSARIRKNPRVLLNGLLAGRNLLRPGLVSVALGLPLIGVFAIDIASPEYDHLPVSIVSYGPSSTVVGQKFNVQPSGYSVIIVTVDQPLTSEAVIIMGGLRLKGLVQGPNVIGEVPERFFSTQREVPLCVQDRNAAGRLARSASVLFTAR